MASGSRRAPGARTARWGLLATTLLLGGALVASSLMSYAGSREAAESVARARAMDVFRAARRAVRRASREGTGRQEVLEELLEEFGEEGLRYLALVGRQGEVLAEVGESLTPGQPPAGSGRELAYEEVEGRVRLVSPMGPGRRGMRGGVRGPPERRQRARLWLEMEPELARTISSRALTTLIVGTSASLLLLVMAFVFWRLVLRAEAAEAALARDRQLKALGEMSAVLGHELKNPLASLKGHAQLLVEKLDESHRAKKNADRVVREALRLETLTGQILDFAKSGAVAIGVSDPRAVLASAVDTVADPRIAQTDAGLRSAGRWTRPAWSRS